jgi:hypothetical protein
MNSSAFTQVSPFCPQRTTHDDRTLETSRGIAFPPQLSCCLPALCGRLRWNRRRLRARRESVYQTRKNAIKRHSPSVVKIAKIRAQLVIPAPRAPVDGIRSFDRRRFINRRTCMRFWETIGQRFRRMYVSRPFLSRERAKPHVMGLGAIEWVTIAAASTGTNGSTLLVDVSSRRRAGPRISRRVNSPTENGGTAVAGPQATDGGVDTARARCYSKRPSPSQSDRRRPSTRDGRRNEGEVQLRRKS